MRLIFLTTATITLLSLAAGITPVRAAADAAPPTTTASAASTSADVGFVRCDPAKIVGSDTCVKCHQQELEAWKQTPHFQTFESLQRKPAAKDIAAKLGLRSVKRNDECTKCHFTTQIVEGHDRVIAGVSCESCHGAAKNWIDLHADYGGPSVAKASESREHRRERFKRSMAAGMNNPTNLYLVARQCLACHTSPNEKLVNVGGHQAGSSEFELVAWSQGMVRHNVLRTGGSANAPSDQSRLRVMYVVGVMADLEASLRATAVASEKATFGVAAAQRAARQKRRLYQISQLVDNQHLRDAVEAMLAARLKLNNREALVSAADAIGHAAQEFAATEDGSKLAAIDALLPPPAQYK
jgi:hypothetical protein